MSRFDAYRDDMANFGPDSDYDMTDYSKSPLQRIYENDDCEPSAWRDSLGRAIQEIQQLQQRIAELEAERSPDSNVEKNRQLLLKRSRVGLRKYGVTTDSNPLSLKEWLQHALEECLDQANYLQAAISEIEKRDTLALLKGE